MQLPYLRLTIIALMAFFASPLGWAAPTPKPAPTVFVDPAEPAALYDRLTYPAKLQPKVEAAVLSEVDGVIEKIHVGLGRKVTKNQTLFTLRRTDPIYQYASVHVRSPVAGVVSQVEFTEGSRIISGQKLMVVIDPDRPKVVIELAAADLEGIKIGLQGELKPVGQDKSYEVKVIGISPFIDSATGTATCEMELVDQSAGGATLPPGLMGKVSFKVNERKGIQIPESAVIFRGKDTFVRTVKDEVVHLAPVKLGNLRRGFYEITEGLEKGVSVVIRTSQYVADGQKVQVQTEETSQFE